MAVKEKVEVTIPSKAIRIQHASCPHGCDLMDESVLIDGYASIAVMAKYKNREGLIHLDPVYGSFHNISELDVKENDVAEFFCPKCGISLTDEGEFCNACSSPMFAIHLPHGGIVEACLKNGCTEHNLRLVDGEELLKRLFEDHTLDSYL